MRVVLTSLVLLSSGLSAINALAVGARPRNSDKEVLASYEKSGLCFNYLDNCCIAKSLQPCNAFCEGNGSKSTGCLGNGVARENLNPASIFRDDDGNEYTVGQCQCDSSIIKSTPKVRRKFKLPSFKSPSTNISPPTKQSPATKPTGKQQLNNNNPKAGTKTPQKGKGKGKQEQKGSNQEASKASKKGKEKNKQKDDKNKDKGKKDKKKKKKGDKKKQPQNDECEWKPKNKQTTSKKGDSKDLKSTPQKSKKTKHGKRYDIVKREEPLTIAELSKAAGILTEALEKIGVEFGILGGGALALLAESNGLDARQTADIDAIIKPDSKNSADSVSQQLIEKFPKQFGAICQFGVNIPAVRIQKDGKEHLVEVELFDIEVWPNRPQYNLNKHRPKKLQVKGNTVYVMSPSWLLREKIVSQAQRAGSAKEKTDIADVENLIRMMGNDSIDDCKDEEFMGALQDLLKKRADLATSLKKVVKCPSAFS
ncbi:hypothetical protein AJ79_07347 [Helicocarpus griseus UAMH5409]|uniref:Uncharacterized protein n=1 Tax=Helicocarpus griseus UAMH5409 TaxID=1447875 RepID=A0A2B7X445_9EURO|nr:hypothetical protein AJ79_07347 [Helicocarpus griseus UAMH5409]